MPRKNFERPYMCYNTILLQNAQTVRPARPQRVKARGGTYRTSCGPFALAMGLGERKIPSSVSDLREAPTRRWGLNDARTPLEDCFSILIGNTCNLRHHLPETRSSAPCRPRGWDVASNCSTASLQRTVRPFSSHRQKWNMAPSSSPISQTAGRGRLSRTWFSPPGANLYCSTSACAS